MNPLFTFFLKHWRGDYSIGKSFWVNASLPALVLMAGDFISLWKLAQAPLEDMLASGSLDQIEAITALPRAIEIPQLVIGNLLMLWWMVGVWNACDNPAHNPKGHRSHWMVKILILLSVLGSFESLAESFF